MLLRRYYSTQERYLAGLILMDIVIGVNHIYLNLLFLDNIALLNNTCGFRLT